MPPLQLDVTEAVLEGLERRGELLLGRPVTAKVVAELVIKKYAERLQPLPPSARNGIQMRPVPRCLICETPLRGRQRLWCSDAHRQEGYRRRRNGD